MSLSDKNCCKPESGTNPKKCHYKAKYPILGVTQRKPQSGRQGTLPRVLHLPLPDRRSKDRREIIIPGNNGSPSTRLDRSLVVAVARGRCWARGLRRGDYKDTAQIASKFDLSEAYVRRILRLAYLAPDVVLAIAEGRYPPTLVLQRLLRAIPLAWAEQRQTLGFTT